VREEKDVAHHPLQLFRAQIEGDQGVSGETREAVCAAVHSGALVLAKHGGEVVLGDHQQADTEGELRVRGTVDSGNQGVHWRPEQIRPRLSPDEVRSHDYGLHPEQKGSL